MKRGLFRTRSVILNSFDYGESDRILSFYTEEHGKIKGIAKGARRSKKRFVGNLEPLSHINLIFFHSEKSELVRVEDSTLIESFGNLKADIDRLTEGYYLLELVSEMTREGVILPSVFFLLLDFLGMLSENGGNEGPLRFFEIRLLSILGYLPHLDACVVCRKGFEGADRVYFSSERGGTVCRNCTAGMTGLVPVSPGTAKSLSIAAKFDTEKLKRLKPAPNFFEESERVLYDFIKFQIGKELKTKKFLEKMRNLKAV